MKNPFKIQEKLDLRNKMLRTANNEILELARIAYHEGAIITVKTPWGIHDATVKNILIIDSGIILTMGATWHSNFYIINPADIHPKDRAHGEPSYLSDVETWGVTGEKK